MQILQLGDERVNRVEKTRDISSGGVCFFSPTDVEVGGRIEYLITLHGDCNPPVRIRCLGKVLRSTHPVTSDRYEVAATMERYQFVREGELEAMGTTA